MAKPLKIGLVLDTSLDPTDGVQQYVLSIGEWLSQKGNEVHYLVGQTDKRQLSNLHSFARNITVHFNGNRTTIPLPTSRKKLRKFLETNHFDVLHVQVPHSPFMAQRLIVAADPETAVVGTFHILPYGVIPRFANHILGIWLRPSLKRFDTMLAVSSAAAEFARQSFHIDTEVVPNVIDYRRYHQAEPLHEYQDNIKTVLFLGRLVKRKGCAVLLQAIVKLRENNTSLPKFRVIVCGTGHLQSSLEQYVKNNNLESIVEFAGFVDEAIKPRYYASADISVFPSSSGESFGIVLLEAMASGRAAVLAGNNPGYNSVMSPKNELLFSPNNANELAEKLKQYLLDNSARKQAAAWGSVYSRNYDVNTVGTRLLEIYNQALLKRQSL